jgi:Tol biopolymer transport system component
MGESEGVQGTIRCPLGGALLAAIAAIALACAAPAGATLPPGENGVVAFEDGAGVNGGDIWTVKADGSQPVNLTNTPSPVDEFYPTFSANGTRIFFVRKSPTAPDEIWSMAVDGSDQVKVLAGTPSAQLFGLAASPDGRWLAFTRYEPPSSEIWRSGVDGSPPTNLTNTTTIFEEVTSFSPDGRSILHKRCVGMDPCDVAVMDTDGSGQTNLTNSSTHEDFSSFSPDGRTIAFERFDDSADIWTMRSDGSAQVNLTDSPGKTGGDDFPVFSGDGSQIYFERCAAICDLWSVPAGGGAATNLTAAFNVDASDPDAQSIQRCGKRQATIVGDDGPNTITGTNGADVIDANGAQDKVNGLGGKDLICGGDGKDKLKGGKGKDRLLGGRGKDKLIGGKGKDSCVGGKGKDRAKGCEERKGI